jgi:hypothetical protein
LESDESEQELEAESDQYGEEELEEQELQEDSSSEEEDKNDLEDAGEDEEAIKEEDGMEHEEVEEPELIFRRSAELDDSADGNVRFNGRALLQIRKSVKKIRQKVSDNNYKEIAVEMSALSRKNSFVHALSELSKIAEFIFHNSLASDMVQNSLFAKTVLLETSDFEITSEDDDNDNFENVVASIRELYATLTNVDRLKEDSISLDSKFGKSQDEESSELITDLETVIEFSNSEDIRQGNYQKTSEPTERFRLTRQNLNTLAMSTTITRTQANEGIGDAEKEIINANRTWQSILKWGENEGLNNDQQTAFEILAATCVLTFSDKAKVDTTNSETSNAFDVRVKGLLQLARKSEDMQEGSLHSCGEGYDW